MQRLRAAMDEHNANIWKAVSRKLGSKITANVCRLKAIELGWVWLSPVSMAICDFDGKLTRHIGHAESRRGLNDLGLNRCK